jgi:para-nitrobenzyl esterase
LKGETGKAYLYNFTLEFPFKNGMLAWHCSDIPFIFNNTDRVEICNIPDVSEKLEKQVFGSLMQFAKTGDPNHAAIPNWPPVTSQAEPTMLFDRDCQVRTNYDDELLAFIEKTLPPFNPFGAASSTPH